jgi:hypothetical protein
MTLASRQPDTPAEPQALHDYASEHLAYIRRTMERAGAFTAVSGKGQMAIGVIGVVAAVWSSRVTDAAWLGIWLLAAVVASGLATVGIVLKARRLGVPLLSGPGRKFALGFVPPLVAGALLTGAVYYLRVPQLLPALWLLLFGAAVLGAGAMSVPPVPVMGACFMGLGVVALVGPADWANLLLGLGFGLLHLVFGAVIAVKYGG